MPSVATLGASAAAALPEASASVAASVAAQISETVAEAVTGEKEAPAEAAAVPEPEDPRVAAERAAEQAAAAAAALEVRWGAPLAPAAVSAARLRHSSRTAWRVDLCASDCRRRCGALPLSRRGARRTVAARKNTGWSISTRALRWWT